MARDYIGNPRQLYEAADAACGHPAPAETRPACRCPKSFARMSEVLCTDCAHHLRCSCPASSGRWPRSWRTGGTGKVAGTGPASGQLAAIPAVDLPGELGSAAPRARSALRLRRGHAGSRIAGPADVEFGQVLVDIAGEVADEAGELGSLGAGPA